MTGKTALFDMDGLVFETAPISQPSRHNELQMDIRKRLSKLSPSLDGNGQTAT